MAEHTIELNRLRVSPAAHLADAMRAGEITGPRAVSLRELPFVPQLGLRCVPGSASAAAVEEALGLPLPARVGEVSGDPDGLHVLWLGPDEFLAVDVSRQQEPGEGAQVAAALDGLPGQCVDLSANRTVLELRGPSAREVLEKGCPADLHPRVFPAGSGIVTQLGLVPVLLHRSDERTFRVFPRASFADFTVRWLLDAMVEFAEPGGS
ncbi:sarcosine oxidase subunit gamma [Leucobacter massiliensis]|uniref:Sarcosine oxidase subunit gamma n=1 Tax=Leucobacter massiliensis TaxID=1686285 RepID=A0A2S9QM43_9MICO|nr:sarcosine oxidase subunit gamma family protein [Leucobacter massiliensis]PRI10663.1 sarcosine oxidase subunit gamma [Leucobacter massiliensis]